MLSIAKRTLFSAAKRTIVSAAKIAVLIHMNTQKNPHYTSVAHLVMSQKKRILMTFKLKGSQYMSV